MARATFVQKARKDVEGTDIKAGDSYYWWKFRFGGKRYSKTAPRRSQLTQSNFLGQLYDLQDRIGDMVCDSVGDFDDFRDGVLADIEDLKSECENNLENMPEQLRESSSGEILQERIDALESWYSEIENIQVEESEDEDELEDNVQNAVSELQNTDSGL